MPSNVLQPTAQICLKATGGVLFERLAELEHPMPGIKVLEAVVPGQDAGVKAQTLAVTAHNSPAKKLGPDEKYQQKLKERVGDRICLWGGIWHEHIIAGTVEDIRNDARYAFQHAAPGGGYIMGSTHSLAVDAKKENVLEMKRCRDEWGGYPIDAKLLLG